MNDLISRQAAIDIADDIRACFSVDGYWALVERLKRLPSAQPEPKKGRWIDMGDHVMCGCCGATHYGVDKNYCPNCGAKMKGEQE